MTTLRRVPGKSLWIMTIVEPVSATQTSIRCDVYSSKPAAKTPGLEKIKEEFESNIKTLEQQFSAISTDTLTQTISAMPDSQHKILRQLENHSKLERKTGAQIFPAADEMSKGTNCGVAEKRKLSSTPLHVQTTHDIAVCRELDSIAESGMSCFKSAEGLAW
jgi:hypothetical protein